MSAFAKGSILGAGLGLALTYLGFLPPTSNSSDDMGAAILALLISAPARTICSLLGHPLSVEHLSGPLVILSGLTNMVLLAVLIGVIGYCIGYGKRCIRRTSCQPRPTNGWSR